MGYLVKGKENQATKPDGMFFPTTIEGSLVEIAATLAARHQSLSARPLPGNYSIHIVEKEASSVSDWFGTLA